MSLNILAALFLIFNFLFLYIHPPVIQSDSVINKLLNVIPVRIIPQETKRKLSLDTIFDDDYSRRNNLPGDKTQVLIVTGDIIPARTVNYKTVTSGNYLWPYEKTAEILRIADITFVNLESPLIDKCPLTTEGMKFCGDPKNIEGLTFAGVDVANLANNHSGNYGPDGLNSTVKLLTNAGIEAAGVDGPVYKDAGGVRFAFLGYNEVGNQEVVTETFKEKIIREIVLAKSNSDITVVQFHWGTEYTTQLTSNQRMLAHLAIDAGADLVTGNHPHWIQPVEIYKGKLIAYAHGNFVFDQEWSKKTKEGVVGKYTFYEKRLVDAEFLPVQIDSYGQPNFLDESKSKPILEELKRESIRLATDQDQFQP